MAEFGSRATSGVFIRPVWRRMPTRAERVVSLVIVGLALVGAALLPRAVGRMSEKVAGEEASRAAAVLRGAFDLSGTTAPEGKPAGPGGASESEGPREKPATSAGAYAAGRRELTEDIAKGMASLKSSVSLRALIIILACSLAAGVVFGFFGWHLRRLTAALGGALLFGGITFTVAWQALSFNWVAAIFIALPMAFCGTLLGWHLVVLFTCLHAGSLAACLAVEVFAQFGGPEHLRWLVPCYLVAMGLGATAAYLFAARALLISAWAAWGALLLTFAALLGVCGFSGYRPPWEAALLFFSVLAIAGTLTQYRLAAAAAEDAPEPAAEPA